MSEKLLQPEENPQEENPLDGPYPVQFDKKAEKETEEKDNWDKISPEDYDFLTNIGFDLGKRKEVETNAETMIEIPRIQGQSSFVRPENFRKWINHLKDEKAITDAKKDLENAFENEDPVDLERMTQKELEATREDFYSLAESVKRLGLGLFDRDRESFAPLIDSENIDSLTVSARNIEFIIEARNIEDQLLSGSIAKIIAAIENIGTVRSKKRVLNEDEESLLGISVLLNNVGEQCINLSSKLGGMGKEDAKKLAESVRRLDESVQSKRNYVARKIEAFREYTN